MRTDTGCTADVVAKKECFDVKTTTICIVPAE